MAVKSAEERLERYMAKRYPDRKPDAKLARIRERALDLFRRQVDLEMQVRKVLWNEPVPTVSYAKYQTFARSVGKAIRRSESGVLSPEEQQRLIEKYKGWDCKEAILKRILAEVFS